MCTLKNSNLNNTITCRNCKVTSPRLSSTGYINHIGSPFQEGLTCLPCIFSKENSLGILKEKKEKA